MKNSQTVPGVDLFSQEMGVMHFQFSKLISIAIVFLVANLVFTFSLVILFLDGVTEGISFSSNLISRSTTVFIVLNAFSLTLFSVVLNNAFLNVNLVAGDREIASELGRRVSRMKRLITLGIAITCFSCISYALIISYTFLR